MYYVGHPCDMSICLEKDRTCNHRCDSNTHICKTLDKKVEGHVHKLYMDNFFSSCDLLTNLTTEKISFCGAISPNRKGMLHSSAS
jgi:hypothetical protein